jgi:hypothetical protein
VENKLLLAEGFCRRTSFLITRYVLTTFTLRFETVKVLHRRNKEIWSNVLSGHNTPQGRKRKDRFAYGPILNAAFHWVNLEAGCQAKAPTASWRDRVSREKTSKVNDVETVIQIVSVEL